MSDAQFLLGNVVHIGKGVILDLGKAVYWWNKAAEQGYAARRR
ncbi:MAG: SEL1-like repeat protein [Spirochaetaceae bacterium]|nr:SEL1-like repeat protein [Spirochaetaceae bacterium]